MQLDSPRSKKRLPNRNITRSGDDRRPSSIFELIKPLPKKVGAFLPYQKVKDNLAFAKDLLFYARTKYPEKVNALLFKPNNTLSDFINELLTIILPDGDAEPIVIQEDEYSHFDVIKPLEDYDPYCFMNIDYCDIYRFKAKPLWIAWAHVMKRLSKQIRFTVLDEDFSDPENLRMFEMHSQQLYEHNSEGNSYKSFVEEYGVDVFADCKVMKKQHQRHDFYLSKNLDLFYNYKPRNPAYKKLKVFLEEALAYDFSILHSPAFSDDTDSSFYCWDDMILIYFGETVMEKEHFNMRYYEDGEGVQHPSQYMRIENGVMTAGLSDEEIAEFLKITSMIKRFYQEIYNPYIDGIHQRTKKSNP